MNADQIRQEIDKIEKRVAWIARQVNTGAQFENDDTPQPLLGRLRAVQAVLVDAWEWLTITEGL